MNIFVHIGDSIKEILRVKIHSGYKKNSYVDDIAVLWMIDLSNTPPACFADLQVSLIIHEMASQALLVESASLFSSDILKS